MIKRETGLSIQSYTLLLYNLIHNLLLMKNHHHSFECYILHGYSSICTVIHNEKSPPLPLNITSKTEQFHDVQFDSQSAFDENHHHYLLNVTSFLNNSIYNLVTICFYPLSPLPFWMLHPSLNSSMMYNLIHNLLLMKISTIFLNVASFIEQFHDVQFDSQSILMKNHHHYLFEYFPSLNSSMCEFDSNLLLMKITTITFLNVASFLEQFQIQFDSSAFDEDFHFRILNVYIRLLHAHGLHDELQSPLLSIVKLFCNASVSHPQNKHAFSHWV